MGVPYAVAARELLRSTVLDAVGAQLADRPWAEVRMLDVAGAAGVSRQTVYKEFGSRSGLAQAWVLREVGRFLDAVEQDVRAAGREPAAALRAAFDAYLEMARDAPLVKALAAPGAEAGGTEVLALLTTQGGPAVELAAGRLAALFAELWPAVSRRDAVLLGDAVVRLAISSAALPVGAVPLDGEAVARLLGPYADRALSGA